MSPPRTIDQAPRPIRLTEDETRADGHDAEVDQRTSEDLKPGEERDASASEPVVQRARVNADHSHQQATKALDTGKNKGPGIIGNVINFFTGGPKAARAAEQAPRAEPTISARQTEGARSLDDCAALPLSAGGQQVIEMMKADTFYKSNPWSADSAPLIASVLQRGVSEVKRTTYRSSFNELSWNKGYDVVRYEITHPDGTRSVLLALRQADGDSPYSRPMVGGGDQRPSYVMSYRSNGDGTMTYTALKNGQPMAAPLRDPLQVGLTQADNFIAQSLAARGMKPVDESTTQTDKTGAATIAANNQAARDLLQRSPGELKALAAESDDRDALANNLIIAMALKRQEHTPEAADWIKAAQGALKEANKRQPPNRDDEVAQQVAPRQAAERAKRQKLLEADLSKPVEQLSEPEFVHYLHTCFDSDAELDKQGYDREREDKIKAAGAKHVYAEREYLIDPETHLYFLGDKVYISTRNTGPLLLSEPLASQARRWAVANGKLPG